MREGAGVIDRSMLGKVTVTGRDRQAFLQGMLTNDVKGLTAGKGTGAAFLDALGKVMVLLNVYALDDRLLIELPPELHREDARAARPLSHLGEGVLRGRRFGLRHRRRPGAGRRRSAVEARGADARPRAVRARGSGHRGRARARDPSARGRCGRLSLLDRGGSRRGALGRHRGRRGARGHAGARHASRRGGYSVVRPGRRRDPDLSRDAPRAARELHQGLLYRAGGRGAREVPRPHQPRALRPRARGRSGSRRRGAGRGGRARTSAASPRPCGPSPSADPSRSATSGASTSSRAAPSTSTTAAWFSGRRSRRCRSSSPPRDRASAHEPAGRTRRARTSCSTPTIPSTGIRGATRRSPAPAARTSPCCSPWATRRVTGAT